MKTYDELIERVDEVESEMAFLVDIGNIILKEGRARLGDAKRHYARLKKSKDAETADEVEAEAMFLLADAGRILTKGKAHLTDAKRHEARAKKLREQAEKLRRK